MDRASLCRGKPADAVLLEREPDAFPLSPGNCESPMRIADRIIRYKEVTNLTINKKKSSTLNVVVIMSYPHSF